MGGSGMPMKAVTSKPMAMPATMPPVSSIVSKNRADPVTGAPVIPSCSDWTSVRPASMTMMPDAMTRDGCMSKGVSPESS